MLWTHISHILSLSLGFYAWFYMQKQNLCFSKKALWACSFSPGLIFSRDMVLFFFFAKDFSFPFSCCIKIKFLRVKLWWEFFFSGKFWNFSYVLKLREANFSSSRKMKCKKCLKRKKKVFVINGNMFSTAKYFQRQNNFLKFSHQADDELYFVFLLYFHSSFFCFIETTYKLKAFPYAAIAFRLDRQKKHGEAIRED